MLDLCSGDLEEAYLLYHTMAVQDIGICDSWCHGGYRSTFNDRCQKQGTHTRVIQGSKGKRTGLASTGSAEQKGLTAVFRELTERSTPLTRALEIPGHRQHPSRVTVTQSTLRQCGVFLLSIFFYKKVTNALSTESETLTINKQQLRIHGLVFM
ncbi:hypothetical protein STEG23_036116, partial [Scotinomys teguina]